MKHRFFGPIAVTLVMALLPTPGGFAQNLPLKLVAGWMQAVPPTAGASAAYFRMVNPTDQPFELVGGRTPVAESVDPMLTTRDAKGMAGMEAVPGLTIPARGELVLQPGGTHLMLMGLREHPRPGENVTLILIINPGKREMQVSLPVLQHAPKEDAK